MGHVITIHQALATLLSGGELSAEQSESVFEQLLAGELDDAQIGSLLSLIQARGTTVPLLVGAAKAMRRHVTPIDPGPGDPVIDTCGTGGAPKTFNVSTGAAIVVAAVGGVRVAKHGSRSRTGRGSAEVVSRLGVNVDAPIDVQRECLNEVGVCFCFAIHHHPAMRHAAAPRRSLGFPTVFNLLGPLTNPARAERQLLGVYDRGKAEQVAKALAQLGTERALVVHGLDGMDEVSTIAPTFVAHVREGKVRTETIDAGDLGLARAEGPALIAPDLERGAAIIREVLSGKPGPCLDIVLVNAGAALMVAGRAADLAEGLRLAREAVYSGAAMNTLARLVEVSNRGAREI